MSGTRPSVSIIIPTMGVAERAASLRTAVRSVIDQEDVCATPIVVLNGTRRSPDVERWLCDEPRVRLIDRREPGLPAALRAGREAVDGEWFGTLDDDDILLPAALIRRIEVLAADPAADVIVTNGYRRSDTGDMLNAAADAPVNDDPLRALLERNWLLPGSWLARSARVGVELFDGMPTYLECTFLGVRFATQYRMRWLAQPTVVYQLDSPQALSRSRAYLIGQVDALRRILELPLERWARRILRRRIASAYHSIANRDLREGALADAWRSHLRSLTQRGGWRYLPFMRHLVRASLRRQP